MNSDNNKMDPEIVVRTGIGGAAIMALILPVLSRYGIEITPEIQTALIPIGSIIAMLYDLAVYKLKRWVEQMRSE